MSRPSPFEERRPKRGLRTRMLVVVLLVLVSVGCDSADSVDRVSFDTHDADPDWSPDGRLIAFASNRGAGGIYVIDPDGDGLSRLFRGQASDVDWSPDGGRIAFVGRNGVYVVRAHGEKPRLVLRQDRRFPQGKLDQFSGPAWAPDGRHLAIVKEEPDFSSAIYVVELDGHGVMRLLPRYRGSVEGARPGSPGAVSEEEPTWAPDGRSIAFQAGDGQIVAASVDDGRRRVIVDSVFGYEPAWSPDGTMIAFQCEGDVCVASADGSADVRRLATEGGDPSWAPDSDRLVFEHYVYGGGGYFSDPQSLSVVDLDSDVQELTFGEDAPSNP
jgi:Tol biopolymer transport system component